MLGGFSGGGGPPAAAAGGGESMTLNEAQSLTVKLVIVLIDMSVQSNLN